MPATSDTTDFSYATPASPDTADLTGATSSNSKGSLFSATTSGLQTLDIVLTNILSDNKKIAVEPYNVQYTLSDGTTGYSALHYATRLETLGIGNLGNVTITGTPADNEVLAYDTTSSKWINQTAAEANIVTSADPVITGTISGNAFLDEDDMSSDSAVKVASQQSIKAYVDSQVTAQDLDFQGDAGGALSIDLDSETLILAGGTGITTTGSNNTMTFAVDADQSGITSLGTLTGLTVNGDANFTGALYNAVWDKSANTFRIEDNAYLVAGTGDDLYFYHSSVGGTSNSFINNQTGDLTIVNNADDKDLILKTDNGSGSTTAYITLDGSEGEVLLGHYNSTKLTTKSTGVDITGVLTTTGNIELGHASDNTLSASSGILSIEGKSIVDTDGTGLTKSSSTLNLDTNSLTEAAIADGDYIVFNDATDSNAPKKEALADVATLFAGTGLSASSSVLSVDASQTQITSVGTIGTGTWQGTAIADSYISSASTWNSKQAGDAGLTSISGLTTAADKMIYTTGSDTYAVTDLTATARTLLDDASTSAMRTTLGLGTSATLDSVDEDNMASNSATLVPTQQSVKAYVDSVAEGLDVKDSAKVATTANITLANTQTIDGVSLSAGDRVLVKDQSTGSQNGVYVVVDGGSWTRATDFDSNTEVTDGTFFFVEQGTVNADSGWVLTTNNPITVGTTALVFSQFSGAGQITAGTGLSKSGNTLSVDAAQTQITSVGTIGTGTWQGTAIADSYISSASTWNAKQAALTFGKSDTNALKLEEDVTTNDILLAGSSNVKGRTYAELKSDLTLSNVENTAVSTWAGTTNITTLGTIGTGVWNGTAVADSYISSASTWNAKQAALTFGIANTNAVKIDDADAADNDYAKLTASGIEGKSYAEVKTDLSLNNVENTALSSWAGTSNITTTGTIGTGTWEATDVAIAHGGTGSSTASGARTNLGLGTAAVLNSVDEDDMNSDSATLLPTQQSVKAYVDANSGGSVSGAQTAITSITNANLVVGRDADNDIDFATDNEIIFRAGGADQIKLTDGALVPITDNDIDLGASGAEFKSLYLDGSLIADYISNSGNLINSGYINNTGYLWQTSDTAIMYWGANYEVRLTHVHNTGLQLYLANQLLFRDNDINIGSPADGDLDINADAEIELNSTLIDINGAVDISGTTTLNDDVTFIGGSYNAVWDSSQDSLEFADNAKATFGTGRDFQLYHNGSNGVIENYTGDIFITNRADDQDIFIRTDNGAGGFTSYVKCEGSTGEAQLFHYGSEKLATKSTGIDVTGAITADGLTVDGNTQLTGTLTVGADDTGYDVIFYGADAGSHLQWDESSDELILHDTALLRYKNASGTSVLSMYHTSDDSYIMNTVGSFNIFQSADDEAFRIYGDDGSGGNAVYFQAIGSTGEAKLYHYGSEKISTESTGISVTGTIELGHASDTTISRASAGVIAVEGKNLSTVDDATALAIALG